MAKMRAWQEKKAVDCDASGHYYRPLKMSSNSSPFFLFFLGRFSVFSRLPKMSSNSSPPLAFFFFLVFGRSASLGLLISTVSRGLSLDCRAGRAYSALSNDNPIVSRDIGIPTSATDTPSDTCAPSLSPCIPFAFSTGAYTAAAFSTCANTPSNINPMGAKTLSAVSCVNDLVFPH
jgi:hypothetical protein